MSNNFARNIQYIFVLLGVFLMLSCSNTRFLKEGEVLYTGARVKIDSDVASKKEKKELQSILQAKLSPKPNTSLLGLRPKLYFYNSTKEPKKEKGFRYWLKYKLGEKPVLLGDVDYNFNKSLMQNQAENKGYFHAKLTHEIHTKEKKAQIVYNVKPGMRYFISQVKFQDDTTAIGQEMHKLADKSLLKEGQAFDLDMVKAERERIGDAMNERGFYYFHSDNIIVQADSTSVKDHRIALNVKLKDNTPELATKQFSIDKVIVLPDYNLQGLKKGKYQIPMNPDSLKAYAQGDVYIIDPEHRLKPKIFDRTLYFKTGDLYNRADHNLTLNRLINLGMFKFIKNEFVLSDSLRHKFDAYYLLTPRELQSLSLEALGRTNSANYGGSELNLKWIHRNFLRGAEQFKTSLYGAFDVQMGGAKAANNIIRAGINTQLSIPRMLTPFHIRSSSAFMPRTNINLGYEFQSRTDSYTLHNFNTSFGYVWKENIKKEHDLKLVNITFVSPYKITDKYDSLAQKNVYLRRVVEKQLIFGSSYTYTYTNTMFPLTNTVYYQGTVDLAGNLVGLLTGAHAEKGYQQEIFGIPFSQYAKIENDFRFYHKFSQKSSLASRIIVGVAYPYGNSENIPFSRQFFVGGTNSIRAFRARTLGPGSYDPRVEQQGFFFDQSGDIKLEWSAEYRRNLYKFLNLAAFVDAGNIWLINEDVQRRGAQFSKDFISEMAVGAGLGLRLDFSILILRLDLAMPLRVPYYPRGERWTLNKNHWGNVNWRKDNLVLNIAIGYPF
ncbi:BamA/TamA family outer membrane protein [Elizabethkingia argentiflava]|uniref:BamA/TamA family outer membrane protein n=1 Tax=Elizabethkingia argenteiflava TaxID=2681556 RepID=A0A845PS79_9FLAO|nr:BamA/TamA family outer membrane protein [Elizabethkingia argenteiflava]NAW51119.1 BamA/TamA family outer membrane protein [Elizabethkingia argenteiflava]